MTIRQGSSIGTKVPGRQVIMSAIQVAQLQAQRICGLIFWVLAAMVLITPLSLMQGLGLYGVGAVIVIAVVGREAFIEAWREGMEEGMEEG